jgi:hypothetical protein
MFILLYESIAYKIESEFRIGIKMTGFLIKDKYQYLNFSNQALIKKKRNRYASSHDSGYYFRRVILSLFLMV